jgi:hypothetical protein
MKTKQASRTPIHHLELAQRHVVRAINTYDDLLAAARMVLADKVGGMNALRAAIAKADA